MFFPGLGVFMYAKKSDDASFDSWDITNQGILQFVSLIKLWFIIQKKKEYHQENIYEKKLKITPKNLILSSF